MIATLRAIILGNAVDNTLPHQDNMPPFGGVPEWPKGSDCKSDAKASVVRIHPPPPRTKVSALRGVSAGQTDLELGGFEPRNKAGRLISMGVFPLVPAIAPIRDRVKAPNQARHLCPWWNGIEKVIGGYSLMVEPQPSKLMMRVRFPLPAPLCKGRAHIAQSVEHFLGKEEVTGSNPVMSSICGLSYCYS